jgi:TetR/AcrR family transcriptional regulator
LDPIITQAPEATHPRISGEERRRQLIEVAIDLFSRNGFGGTTTREIAVAAGVTEAMIFRHFATKQDLYAAILDHVRIAVGTDRWPAEFQALMDENDDEGLFRRIVSGIVKMHRTQPRFERLMLHAALEGHEIAVMHHSHLMVAVGNPVREYIERRQSEGTLRGSDPMAVILAAAGMARSWAMQKYLFQICESSASDEEAIEVFLRILLDGLKPADEGNHS